MDTNNHMYVISLDAVDFNNLPITHRYPDGKMMPLWSKQNLDMRNDDYGEFVIKSVYSEEQDSRDGDDQSDEEIDYTICYICDIKVPSPFLKQHYDSVKHKTYLKITNTAMERARKSINTKNNEEVSRNSPLYFCPVCVIAVNTKEKKLHNKSFSHKNAVSIEKFLQDFSSLYTKEDNTESSDSGDSDGNSDIDNAIDSIIKRQMNSFSRTPKTNGVKQQVNSVSNRKDQETSNIKQNGKTLSEINGDKNRQIEKIDALEQEAAKNYRKLNGNSNIDAFVNTKSNKSQDSKKINQIMKDDDDDDDRISNYSFANSDETANSVHLELNKRSHHHLESTLFHTYCRICKKNINDSDYKHLFDLNHEINYEKFLDENAIYKKDSKLMECKICNVTFTYEKEIEHSDQIRHISNYEKYKKRNCHEFKKFML